jgi:hypothetical protein
MLENQRKSFDVLLKMGNILLIWIWDQQFKGYDEYHLIGQNAKRTFDRLKIGFNGVNLPEKGFSAQVYDFPGDKLSL